jgi:hypothetical protein
MAACLLLPSLFPLRAELAIQVAPPEITSNKAIFKLGLQNHLTNTVGSAKATLFLLDDAGNVVAQNSRWIIGGETNRPVLKPGATNVFFFVIDTAGKPFVTNRLMVTRLLLESGQVAQPLRDVTVSALPGK